MQGQGLHSMVKRSLRGNLITAHKDLTCSYKHNRPKRLTVVCSHCHGLQLGRFRLDVRTIFSLGGCAAPELGPVEVIEASSLEDVKTWLDKTLAEAGLVFAIVCFR